MKCHHDENKFAKGKIHADRAAFRLLHLYLELSACLYWRPSSTRTKYMYWTRSYWLPIPMHFVRFSECATHALGAQLALIWVVDLLSFC